MTRGEKVGLDAFLLVAWLASLIAGVVMLFRESWALAVACGVLFCMFLYLWKLVSAL